MFKDLKINRSIHLVAVVMLPDLFRKVGRISKRATTQGLD